jgi:DNA polymerase I-like protein with 3'-5' exonuclease and polymerase domains
MMRQALRLATRQTVTGRVHTGTGTCSSTTGSIGTYSYHRRAVLRLHSALADVSSLVSADEDEQHHGMDEHATVSFFNNTSAERSPTEHSYVTVDDLPEYIRVTLAPPPPPPRTDPVDLSDLRSKPIPGGNWKPPEPLAWAATFGRRSLETACQLAPLVKLRPGDDGYVDVSRVAVPGATIVRTKEQAEIVLRRLYAADQSIYHACDTEVMAIDLDTKGPIGNGYVTCVSVYSGPDFDYGSGPGNALWIDNLDDAAGILQLFKDWFEDDRFKKVWHNYGFDRHVMWNEGIDCRGFGGDTMHMARLQDTSRAALGTGSGYSLEALTGDILGRRKVPMKEIFGVKRIKKDGTEGALVDIPPVEVMQRDPEFRTKWIKYSCYDAEGTWLLREKLQEMLENTKWQQGKNMFDYYEMFMRAFGEVLTDMERRGIRVDAKDYLAGVEVQARKDRARHMEAFLEWAAKKLGPDGLAMNPASSVQLSTFLFGGSMNTKTKEATEAVRTFKVPREEIPENALAAYEKARQLETGSSDGEPDDYLDAMSAVELKHICKMNGLKVSGKKAELQERIRGYLLNPPESPTLNFDEMSFDELQDQCKNHGLPYGGTEKELRDELKNDCAYSLQLGSASTPNSKNAYETIGNSLQKKAENNEILQEILNKIGAKKAAGPKFIDVTITSIGMKPQKYTIGGAPSVTSDVIKTLAGDPFRDKPKWGTAMEFFKTEEEGQEACKALYSLGAIGSIDTMIANFLSSLQYLADEQNRVHCSLNLNTETGRLSSRRPNLQNQPALEKDTYKIRKAFQSSPGNNLIVADYGQLELRLLASITKCVSMIEAFKAGGDFHSRTAIDMYDYVKKAVNDGDCLLEWDYEKGDPPKPLLKDRFASERRQAKTLNFSIAYGKTAFGLSKDWGITKDEAEKTVEKWYNARPEVLNWQRDTKKHANIHGVTRTMMGRYRHLPDAKTKNMKALGHAERAAINTPIQGGAADVAMMAMIKINDSEKLKRLGWILLLQIHDEVILEGPEETAEEAFEEVIQCMQHPWVFGLSETAVPLLVDGSYIHTNWYEAK